ncbi:hypothetical protein [Carboxylicivirga marina]|uniref:hypothetical protein n=1 Tax=Carboxylicivirga marina TaxID=2800988 RepID=UPI0025921553|nr:hypothetical protein [uncultured Carboxylicivirga sp.]
MKSVKVLLNNMTGRMVLMLFVLCNLVYVGMLMVTIPQTMQFANGMDLLDMMPMGYDVDYVSKLLTILGEEGRYVYQWRQIPVDMMYPFLFILCYSAMMAYVLRKIKKLRTSLWYLCLIPLIAGLFDYAENFGIIGLLNSYPNISLSLVSLTSVFSVIKSTSTTLYFLILIVLLLVWGIQSMRPKSEQAS